MSGSSHQDDVDLLDLPGEVTEIIFSFLPLSDLASCSRVSSGWRTHVNSPRLWRRFNTTYSRRLEYLEGNLENRCDDWATVASVRAFFLRKWCTGSLVQLSLAEYTILSFDLTRETLLVATDSGLILIFRILDEAEHIGTIHFEDQAQILASSLRYVLAATKTALYVWRKDNLDLVEVFHVNRDTVSLSLKSLSTCKSWPILKLHIVNEVVYVASYGFVFKVRLGEDLQIQNVLAAYQTMGTGDLVLSINYRDLSALNVPLKFVAGNCQVLSVRANSAALVVCLTRNNRYQFMGFDRATTAPLGTVNVRRPIGWGLHPSRPVIVYATASQVAAADLRQSRVIWLQTALETAAKAHVEFITPGLVVTITRSDWYDFNSIQIWQSGTGGFVRELPIEAKKIISVSLFNVIFLDSFGALRVVTF